MNLYVLAATLLLSGIITDFTWAMYIQKLAEYKIPSVEDKENPKRRKLILREAAFWSSGTGLCTVFLIEGIIVNFYVSLFWLVGLWIGTYYSNTIEVFLRKLFRHKI